METNYHKPVLLEASVDGLNIKKSGVYVDATFGGGGHSEEILRRLGKDGRLFAFDQDEDALKNALPDERFTLINENFRHITRFLKFYGITEIDGILADFGISSHQIDSAARGFSTRFEGDLDMRMDRRQERSALEVINTYSPEALKRILFQYGELRNAGRIARTLDEARRHKPIRTTNELNEILKPHLPKGRQFKVLAQVYQAIRIEVNQELEVIKELLDQLPSLVRIGGRVVFISYHSLEDRLVKRFIRSGRFEGEAEKDFYGNPIVPFRPVGKMIRSTEEEIERNSRARSARLRIAERIEISKKQIKRM